MEAEAWYQDFSLEVGLRDWVVPNPRHEQLKLIVGSLLADTDGQRILDVGCGAGVMTDYLRRHGDVTGIDFSRPAIALAETMVPEARFEPTRALSAIRGEAFDVITLFDVVEHVPPAERSDLFTALAGALRPGGRIIASSPHPAFTRWLHAERPDLLQIVDEPVELGHVMQSASAAGLELRHYETFDIERSGPQYQLLVLTPPGTPGEPGKRRASLDRRLRVTANPAARILRRLGLAQRLVRRGHWRLGAWLVLARGTTPPLPRGRPGSPQE